ncbi:MAG: hypothetical protein HYW48_05245 [Deltaproteobacteria bacterium]|nr:hypothetical protein [Deltaproteobacteria bacterium]
MHDCSGHTRNAGNSNPWKFFRVDAFFLWTTYIVLSSCLLSTSCIASEFDTIIESMLAEEYSRESANYVLSHQPYGTYLVRKGPEKLIVSIKTRNPNILGAVNLDQDRVFHTSFPDLAAFQYALRRRPEVFRHPLRFDNLLDDAFVSGGRAELSTAQSTALLEKQELGTFLIRQTRAFPKFYISVRHNKFPETRDFLKTIGTRTKHLVFHLSFYEFDNAIQMIKQSRRYFRIPYVDKSIFDLDGIHSETGVDRFGFDREGFDGEGYDTEGYDRHGFNKAGLDRAGFGRDGFNTAGRNRDGFDRAGYDIEGYDREGFNRDGFNRDGRNRAFSQVQREELELPAGFGEIDQYGYDQSGFAEQLPFAVQFIERFNRDGFNVWGFNFFRLQRLDFEQWGFDTVLRHQYIPDAPGDNLLQRFNRECFPLLDPIELEALVSFAALRVAVNHQNAMEDERIRGFLRKGIYVCNIIYGGGLNRQFDPGALKWNMKQLAYKVNDLDYGRMLDALAAEHPQFDYFSAIYEALKRPEILTEARYIEEQDNANYAHSMVKKKEHLLETLVAYIHGLGVRQLEKGRYQLFRIALALPRQSHERLVNAAQLLLHGGAHCPDAKRDAVDAIFRGWIPQQALQELRAQVLGTGLNAQLRAFIRSMKEQYLGRWINRKIERDRLNNEQASFFPATWDSMAPHLGLEPMGAYEAMSLDMDIREFFRPDGGNFTPVSITQEFVASPLYGALVEAVFGPIMQLSSAQPLNHPLPYAILLRFGYLSH